jgi:SAM-dependent methyltransferase
MDSRLRPLFEAATRPYANAGRRAWHFTRGKLRYDPVYFALLRRGLLPDAGRLFDLGCGTGILLTLLGAAAAEYRLGRWPAGWPPPPLHLDMHGVELRDDRVAIARGALGNMADVISGNICDVALCSCSAVVLLDVLLYLPKSAQRQVLERAVAALRVGGVLLLREADAGAGIAFKITKWAERVANASRGQPVARLYYRRAYQWVGLLQGLGLSVSALSMSEGTPFSNMLFVAQRLQH